MGWHSVMVRICISYVINTAPFITMLNRDHEIKPNGNDLIILCSFPPIVAVLWKGGRSFINRDGIVCFSQVAFTMAAPLYFEEDKQRNFPMNDLGLFTLTNHRGQKRFSKKKRGKNAREKFVLCNCCTFTRHWYLSKTAFLNWVMAYSQTWFYKITLKCWLNVESMCLHT